jgi:uncharacterized protein (DUF1800 family)
MKKLAIVVLGALVLAGCAGKPPAPPALERYTPTGQLLFLDRVTWGANATAAREMAELGAGRWLERQLTPPPGDDLPPKAAAQVAAMTITQRPVLMLAADLGERRRSFLALADDAQKKMEQQAFQQELTRLGREAASRSVLRALYSPWQLREHMTWFWMNHFNVFMFKAGLRATVGDYEESAIRPHALGNFRKLLGAAARHPAMLRYLDNAQNAAGRLNENFARELMELHTLGADGGYRQQDVQELARVLTGFGIVTRETARRGPTHSGEYLREGLFEFNPKRHDYGAKVLLGKPIRARGVAELDEALDLLARHPSTARFVSRKLAVFFVSDEPPAALVERVAGTWTTTDGNIPAVLRTLFSSEEFRQSLGSKFKDPIHFVFSALRLAANGEQVADTSRILGGLGRLGQPLYARPTPDGYPLTRMAWASAGQLAVRFEVARAIAYAGDWRIDPSLEKRLGPATVKALASAATPQERNLLYISSPEFMHR